MKRHVLMMLAGTLALAAPASAEPAGEIGYPEGSLGYNALMTGDYATAEAQLVASSVTLKDDPGRLINLGYVLARTGRVDRAQRLFERAAQAEDVEIMLADGRWVSSREAAMRALKSLKTASR